MTAFLTRLISGDGLRKSRLHNYRGDFVGLRNLPNLPRCMLSAISFKLTGRHAARPWLSYSAIRLLSELVKPDWHVLEFGSVMSTDWMARRCRHVTSIESDAVWYERTTLRLRQAGLSVDYRFCPIEQYGDFGDIPPDTFDLAIVDGVDRDIEAQRALEAVKPGGFIFYDNSDVQYPPHLAARKILLNRAEHVRSVNDFCPPGVQVVESMLFRVPSNKSNAANSSAR